MDSAFTAERRRGSVLFEDGIGKGRCRLVGTAENQSKQERRTVLDTMTADVTFELEGEEIPEGTRVDVRSRFIGEWTRGFEVAEVAVDGYRIRRVSDRAILPEVFSPEDVRIERRKQGFWWH
jgi:hypothetical protein